MQAAATAERDATTGQPFAAEWDTPYRPAALRAHRPGAFPAGFRPRAGRTSRRDRGDRGRSGGAELRQHGRRAGAERPAPAPRLCRLLQPRRRAYQRRHPGGRARDGAAARQASQRHLHERGPVPARRGSARPSRDPRRGAGARARAAITPSSRGPARSSTRMPRSASPRSPSGLPASARSSARTCSPTRRTTPSFSRARRTLPACPNSCARRRRGSRRSAAIPASTSSPCRARASSPSCNSRRAAICASRRSAPGPRAASAAEPPTTRPSSPRWWRCGPSAPRSSASRPSPISSCTT